MRKVHGVVRVLGLEGECECVIRNGAAFAADVVGVIANVRSGAMPALSFQLLRLGRVAQGHQPVVVKRITLHHVYDVELVARTRDGVFNSEEKPLRVAVGVDVCLQDKIVLVLSYMPVQSVKIIECVNFTKRNLS